MKVAPLAAEAQCWPDAKEGEVPIDLSFRDPPMWHLAVGLFALVATNAVVGTALALVGALRDTIGAGEIRAWVYSTVVGCLVAGGLSVLSTRTDDAYYLAILWMLGLLAVAAAGLRLRIGSDPDRRVLGSAMYRATVVASSSWMAAVVIIQAWVGR